MLSVEEEKREMARKKAKGLRYKRPIAKDLNWHQINEELYEMQSECTDVAYAIQDEDILDAAFDGDDEQAFEFRIAFQDLVGDLGKMRNAINAVEVWDEYDEKIGDACSDEVSDDVPPIFDIFFPAIEADGGFLGFDTFEGDYYGLEWYSNEWATKEARKKIMKLTKEQLLDAAGQCLRVVRQYLALRYRYDCLEASLSILRGQEQSMLRVIKAIEEAYEKIDEYDYSGIRSREFDELVAELPDRVWIE